MQNTVAQELGAKIKSVRVAQKLTQEKLAERIGKSIGLVGQIERGEAMPSVDTLLDIIRALRVSPNGILGELAPGDSSVSTRMLHLLSSLEEEEQEYVLKCVQNFYAFIKKRNR